MHENTSEPTTKILGLCKPQVYLIVSSVELQLLDGDVVPVGVQSVLTKRINVAVSTKCLSSYIFGLGSPDCLECSSVRVRTPNDKERVRFSEEILKRKYHSGSKI